MAAQSFCKEMFPTMDAVMPGGSCLTAFAKKKVAIEMQNKLHKFQQSGSGDIIRHVIPTNTSHRRRVDESRVGLSFERQPSRCTVVVIQSFKARTQDEVQVKRGEHVKLLFIEEEWAYICRKVKAGKKKHNSMAVDESGDVEFGYIPQSHCRQLTESESQQKRVSHRHRAPEMVLAERRVSDYKLPNYSHHGSSVTVDESGHSSCVSPTPSAFVNPYLQLDIQPSDDNLDEEDSDYDEDRQSVEEYQYSFRTQETTSSRSNHTQHVHHRQNSDDSRLSSASGNSYEYGVDAAGGRLDNSMAGSVITFPGMMSSPAHCHGDYDSSSREFEEDTVSGCEVNEEELPLPPTTEQLQDLQRCDYQHQLLQEEESSLSQESQISLPYPALAMFDFHGDGDSGNSGKGETHLTVSKGQLLTVVNFSQTNSDWVVACTEDGRQGILPFCFAQCCDQFPGYPFGGCKDKDEHTNQDMESQDERPGTELRRHDSQKCYYSDTMSLMSDGSQQSYFYPTCTREAPDGQSIDLQRLNSGSSGYCGNKLRNSMTLSHRSSGLSTMSASSSSSGGLRRVSASSSCILDNGKGSKGVMTTNSTLDRRGSPPNQLKEQHGRIAPAPSMNFTREDTAIATSPTAKDTKQQTDCESTSSSKLTGSMSMLCDANGQSIGPRHGVLSNSVSNLRSTPPAFSVSNLRSTPPVFSVSNLRSTPPVFSPQQSDNVLNADTPITGSVDEETCLDLRVNKLTGGVRDLHLRDLPPGVAAVQSVTQSHRPQQHQRNPPCGSQPPVPYNRSTSAPSHMMARFNPDRRHSTPDVVRRTHSPSSQARSTPVNADRVCQSPGGQIIRQLTASPRRLPLSTTTETARQSPAMISNSDIRMTLAPPSSRNNTMPRQRSNAGRQERIPSKDSALGGSSDEDLSLSQSRLPDGGCSSTPKRQINTQLVVKKDFKAKGDNQLNLVAGEVVVVADDRDHKDWLWVFAPMQRAFGFVPTVFTKERQM